MSIFLSAREGGFYILLFILGLMVLGYLFNYYETNKEEVEKGGCILFFIALIIFLGICAGVIMSK